MRILIAEDDQVLADGLLRTLHLTRDDLTQAPEVRGDAAQWVEQARVHDEDV